MWIDERSRTDKHVSFVGVPSQVSDLNLSDHVSIGSGYQPLPIPRTSVSWQTAYPYPKDVVRDDYEVLHPRIEHHSNEVERLAVGDINQNILKNFPDVAIGSSFNNPMKFSQLIPPVLARQGNRPVIGRSAIKPRVIWEEHKVENPKSESLSVQPMMNKGYLNQTSSPNVISVAPSVISSTGVVNIPAYNRNTWNSSKPISSGSPHNYGCWSSPPFDICSRSAFTGNPSLVRRNDAAVAMKDLREGSPRKAPQSSFRSDNMGNSSVTNKQKPQKKRQNPSSKIAGRRTLIKVNPSIPSMNRVQIDHGCQGDIFIGNYNGACSLKLCRENNINAIVNLSFKLLTKHPHIVYHEFPIGDLPSEDILSLFNRTYNIIEGHLQAGNNVLVNCNMGVSRSTTIVLAYIIKKTRMDLASALALCRRHRACCNPNHGFIKQLKKYEKLLHKSEIKRRMSENVNIVNDGGRQKFMFSFPSCYSRTNNKEIAQRETFRVL